MSAQADASTTIARGLDAAARRRLERFAEAFDTIPASEFLFFAGPGTPPDDLRRAMDDALEQLGSPAKRDAVKQSVARFVKAAEKRYAERFGIAEVLGMGLRGSTAEDRVRVFQSLERAVVAVALWDLIDEDSRVQLAGPWADLVEYAVAEP